MAWIDDSDPHNRYYRLEDVDLRGRLATHRTISPTAKLLKTWPCRKSWERAAIDSLTAENCTLIGGEVYLCTDIGRLLQRGDTFFACMPSLIGKEY